ncbi:DUF4012 domain-containing protein [Arthrobacter sp. RT-1]|nr:DUF4012 domain-containing protein [Arthrobacter sp. RT-1]
MKLKTTRESSGRFRRRHSRFVVRLATALGAVLFLLGMAGVWTAVRAVEISSELQAAKALVPTLIKEMSVYDDSGAGRTLDRIDTHTTAARSAADDPVWKLASGLPWLGINFSAVRELTVAADEIAKSAAKPLLSVLSSLDVNALTPVEGRFDLEPLRAASPTIVSAATTVELSRSRLREIDQSNLVGEVAVPLSETITTLDTLGRNLDTASQVSRILPSMMGANETRDYLVLVQNNAELRASGGLPGALAVIRVDNGLISLVGQASGADIGKFEPPLELDEEQKGIYSSRLGAFISDVNLTPDFPTTAKLAKGMWERRYGTPIHGVLGLDPIVLAHILEASGPIDLSESGDAYAGSDLPNVLTSENVVKTLLSDVYLNLETNEMQDAYFIGATAKIFDFLASGRASGPALMKALTLSYEEGRVHVWSDDSENQSVLSNTQLGGSAVGPSAGGTSFGVYFNDGTGAKMDYYVRRTVKLVEVCTNSEYAEYRVKITSVNAAPLDAATSLPTSVTGDGRYGTPPGSVQTNIAIYGPALSYVDSANQDGTRVNFGAHLHGNRPVGIVTTRLGPGESSEIEMAFVKVVQQAAPTLRVTPTAQPVKDVTMPTEFASCK